MIEITGLKKKFDGLAVLKNIDLRIEDGEVFGLIGLSGAGKSTLLRCMSGLERYDEGHILIDGTEAMSCIDKNNSVLRRNTGMIFQQFALLGRMTVRENVALPMRCWGYSKGDIDERVRELLSIVGLEGRLDDRPAHLSGGQKQRVAIARALSMNPSILFCDEATSALDPITTASILDLLRSINDRFGVTIVVVTHEMSVVKRICGKTAILAQGEIRSVGSTDDVFLRGGAELRGVLGDQVNGAVGIRSGDIRLIFRDEDENKTLLNSAVSDMPGEWTIVWSSFDTYRGRVKGYYIIRVSDGERGRFIDRLRRSGVEFAEVNADDE